MLIIFTLLTLAACDSSSGSKSGSKKKKSEDTEASEAAEVAKSISFTESRRSAKLGESFTLTPVFKPENTIDKSLTWSSSNDEIASVDENGNVSCHIAGQANIIAKTSNGKTAECWVLVLEIEPETITLSETSKLLEVGETLELKATLTPEEVTSTSVSWETSDKKVATVSAGQVKAISHGKCVITCTTSNGLKAECEIEVNPITLKEVLIEREELALTVGDSYKFLTQLRPTNTTMKTLTFTSSDPNVVTAKDNSLSAKKAGTAVLTVESQNGIKKTCTITVLDKVADDPNDTRAQTNKPSLGGKTMCANGYAVEGECEEGAKIYVTSHLSTKTLEVESHFGVFVFNYDLPAGWTDTITVTAQVEGKKMSKPATMDLKPADAEGNAALVFIGEHSWLHYFQTEGDYKGTNLFSSSELSKLQNTMEKRLAEVQKRSGRDDTTIIFFIAPNNATVYPEYAPTEWKQNKKSDNSRRQQIAALGQEMNNPYIKVVDSYDIIAEHRYDYNDIGRLYYETDTHWNTMGAYYGYYKLMSVIAEKFPAAAPYELSKFNINQIEYTGDMASYLGLGIVETTLSCTLKSGFSRIDSHTGDGYGSSGIMRDTVVDSELPVAVVQRDSFGTALHRFLAEHFSILQYTSFGADKSEALKYCEELSPDYYIRIMVERDLYSKTVN